MIKYYIDPATSDATIVAAIADAKYAGKVAYQVVEGLYALLRDSPNDERWYALDEVEPMRLEEPSWFPEYGLEVGQVSVTYDNLPYDPQGCSPYMGVYNQSPDYPGCDALVDAHVTPQGAAVIRVIVTGPISEAESYYSAIRSRAIVPDEWLQPVPSTVVKLP